MGWASASNMVAINLVYFYIPPTTSSNSTDSCGTSVSNATADNSDATTLFPIYVPQVSFAAVLNTIVILAALGRLWDAVTDPCIASFSDRLRWKRGRRLPLMAMGALPTAVFSALLFFPPVEHESLWNVAWLGVVQLLFYLALTAYCTPFFALVPEFGHTEKQRLELAVACSMSFALGAVLSTTSSSIGSGFASAQSGLQFGIAVISVVNLVLMIMPVAFISEAKHVHAPNHSPSLLAGMRHCATNKYFRAYVMADLAFCACTGSQPAPLSSHAPPASLALPLRTAKGRARSNPTLAVYASAMIQTALPFYTTVLVCAPELLTPVIGVLVLVSLIWYYPVARLAGRYGKKRLVLGAMLLLSACFCAVGFLGDPLSPLPPALQLFGGVAFLSVPLSAMGMLPNACLADIVVHDALRTGQSTEGMFFGARTFLQKIGTTLGIMTFASLTNLGNSPGAPFETDLGVRLSGPACALVFCIACLCFSFYDEASLQRETRAMLQAREDAGIQASPAALSDTAGGASSKIRVEPTSHDATGT